MAALPERRDLRCALRTRARERDELKNDLGFLFTESAFEEKLAAEQRAYALNWLMIPLTRSMDHLVIHLTAPDSALGHVLQGIDRDKINWR